MGTTKQKISSAMCEATSAIKRSPHPEDSIVLAYSFGSSHPIVMASNRVNQSLEDQFLRWCQDMETKQEEQAR